MTFLIYIPHLEKYSRPKIIIDSINSNEVILVSLS